MKVFMLIYIDPHNRRLLTIEGFSVHSFEIFLSLKISSVFDKMSVFEDSTLNSLIYSADHWLSLVGEFPW